MIAARAAPTCCRPGARWCYLGDPTPGATLLEAGRLADLAGTRMLAALLGDRAGRPTTRSTSSTRRARPGSRRARRSRTTTSSTTGSSSGSCATTPPDDRICDPGALLPLLRHGDGQPRRDQPRRPRSIIPGARVRPRPRRCRRCRPSAAPVAVRRPDHVHRRAGRPGGFAGYDLSQPADRDHGRLAVPGRGDEAGHRPDGDDEVSDLLRHDRDLARLDPDPGGRLARAPRRRPSAGCMPHLEVKVDRPGDRPHRSRAATPRRAVHPRLLGDARLLGRSRRRRPRSSTRPGGCTPATSP